MSSTRPLFLLALLALLALFASTFAGLVTAGPAQAEDAVSGLELSQEELVQRLRAGGYVIYMRHARTDRTKMDGDEVDLADCSTQRPLSDLGRREAAAVGESLRAMEIPVGPVFTSPYCRCVETAQLVFGRGQKSDGLYYARDVADAERVRLSSQLRELLATRPPEGKNTFIVSHTSNLEDAVGIHPRPEGVSFVFEPLPDGELRTVGRLLPAAWPALAQAWTASHEAPAKAAD